VKETAETAVAELSREARAGASRLCYLRVGGRRLMVKRARGRPGEVGVDLDGKAALITGGGRGIGRATALMLAEDGADVAVLARSVDEIEAVACDVRALGRRSIAIPCDVTAYDACKLAVDQAVAELGSAPQI
jgi:hypothetical protein